MKLHFFVIAIIVVGMVTIGVTGYITSLGEGYSKTADFSGLQKTQTEINRYMNTTDDLSDDITRLMNTKLSPASFFTIPYELVKAGWTSIVLMLRSVFVTESIINELGTVASESAHIPSFVLTAIMSIIFVLVIAMLVYAFFKWKIES